MLFPAKLVRKQSRQGVGALQLRTTALHLDAAGNIDNVGYTDKVTATDFYHKKVQQQFNKDHLNAGTHAAEDQKSIHHTCLKLPSV